MLLSWGEADVERNAAVEKQELTFCCEIDSLPRCGIQERLRPQVRSNYMVLMMEDFCDLRECTAGRGEAPEKSFPAVAVFVWMYELTFSQKVRFPAQLPRHLRPDCHPIVSVSLISFFLPLGEVWGKLQGGVEPGMRLEG